MQLSSWDKEELDDKLANRVQVSKRAVSKVVQAFDRLSQRNEKITLALKGEFNGGKCDCLKYCNVCVLKNNNLTVNRTVLEEAPNIDEVVRRANAEIQMENRNLQAINIQLHEKYHTISLKVIKFYFISLRSSFVSLSRFFCITFLSRKFCMCALRNRENIK